MFIIVASYSYSLLSCPLLIIDCSYYRKVQSYFYSGDVTSYMQAMSFVPAHYVENFMINFGGPTIACTWYMRLSKHHSSILFTGEFTNNKFMTVYYYQEYQL